MNRFAQDKINSLINRYGKYYALIYIYLIFAFLCVILNGVISLSDKFMENYIVIPTTIGLGLFACPWFTSLGVCMFRHMQGRGNVENWPGIFFKIVSWELGFVIYPFWYCFGHKKIHIRFSKWYQEFLAKRSSKSPVSKKNMVNKKT